MILRRSPRRTLAAVLVGVLALGLAACGGDDDEDTAGTAEAGTVRVIDNEFDPATVDVSVGDTVTWSFEGAVQHNVVGDGFKSENKKDGTFEHTFDSAGDYDYDYVCTLHPGMKGKVRVG